MLQAADRDEGLQIEKLGCYGESREILRIHGIVGAYTHQGRLHGATEWQFEGQEIFKKAVHGMGSACEDVLKRAGLSPDDIDLVIPHQANLRIIEHVSKAIDFPMEKIFVNLDRYGNTSAASIPIALSEAVAAGRLKPGDVFCTVAFGGGYTSGAFVTRWDADPAHGARAASVDASKIVVIRPEGGAKADVVPAALRAHLDGRRR